MSDKDKMSKTSTRWWKGTRGEWYVVAQGPLFALVVFGPRTWPGESAWAFPYAPLVSAAGVLLLLMGGLLAMAGMFKLGPNLTPLPYPKDETTLLQTGPYRIVRHPIYSGAILMAFGWAFWVQGWLTIVYAMILLLFFDIKARREEQWLKEKLSGYSSYQKRVRKLIPFIY
jgi:protein-S-isoprenylcysteine O-methyltransferase Ste14